MKTLLRSHVLLTCIFFCLTLFGTLQAQPALNFVKTNSNAGDVIGILNPSFDNLGTSDFTIEANIAPDANQFSSVPIIFSMRGSRTSDGFILALNGTSGILFQIGGDNYVRSNLGVAGPDTCFHIAVKREQGIMTLFIDGQQVSTLGTDNANISFIGDAAIGYEQGSFTGFNGQISEVRLWQKARSDSDLSTYAFQSIPNPTQEEDLVGYWKLNEGEGTTVNDSSSFGNDGILGTLPGRPEPGIPNWVDDGICSITLSTEETNLSPTINLYPNPAKSFVQLEGIDSYAYEIYDLQGRLHLSGETSTTINVKSLSKGMYLLKVSDELGNSHVVKLIK